MSEEGALPSQNQFQRKKGEKLFGHRLARLDIHVLESLVADEEEGSAV